MNFDLTITTGHIITLAGYVILAIGVYFGIRIDLARLEERRTMDKEACARAQNTADAAHSKINEHVITFHSHRIRG